MVIGHSMVIQWKFSSHSVEIRWLFTFMKLENLQVYQLSMEIGDKFWEIVIRWDYFVKEIVCKQCVKVMDSVVANLSEEVDK